MSTFQRLDPIERDEATTLLESSDSGVIAETILRLALHDPDAQWVTSRALALFEKPDADVRNSAATALGHIARIHRSIDRDRVVPALQHLRRDPKTRGRAEDALDDIAIFAPPGSGTSCVRSGNRKVRLWQWIRRQQCTLDVRFPGRRMTSPFSEGASLAGFELDLHDRGARFSSNGFRLLSGVALPAGFAVLFVVVSLALGGCDRAIDQAMVPDVEASTDPALVAEAGEYGEWVLPSRGKVLLVEREVIRDRRYRIAVEVSPADLVSMLEQSRFPTVLAIDYPPYLQKTIAGPPLESSPKVLHAQEWFTSSAGKVMLRDVTVDERDVNTRIVHIDFRGV